MRLFAIAFIYLLMPGFSYAENVDALILLKRDLGSSIEVVSNRELRYCPDNTCDIIKSKKPIDLLSEYFYLHLFHESGYVYLGMSFKDQKPFRETAIEEPEVRKKVEKFCPDIEKTPECILEHMRSRLGIQACFGRYDEGHFCYGCSENENICKKL